jgi:hypothetical protein
MNKDTSVNKTLLAGALCTILFTVLGYLPHPPQASPELVSAVQTVLVGVLTWLIPHTPSSD